MTDVRAIPGDRAVRATVSAEGADAVVVACPPHPQFGGSRRDARLRALSAALAESDIACLRLDYGPWDDGVGEVTDVANAIDWSRDRYDTVGLFGYSFGAGIALRVAAERTNLCAVSVLAPPETSVDAGDVTAAVEAVVAPLQVVVGERDDTVEWAPVAEAAAAAGAAVERVPGDHFFVGQTDRVVETASAFLAAQCDS
jgi:alpha/beta superfamily hydrolase